MYRKRIGEKAPYQSPLPDPIKTGSLLYNLERERSVFINFVQHVAIREFVRK